MSVNDIPSDGDLGGDRSLVQAIMHARLPLIFTDPTAANNPIVFANHAFCALTGYAADEVLGRNCRFLQGADTTRQSVTAVRDIIATRRVDTVEILNYRKDGATFLNSLQIGPIFDTDGALVYFFGSQLDITARRQAEDAARELAEQELMHRLRNIVNVMAVTIRATAREVADKSEMTNLLIERLSALGTAQIEAIRRPRGEAARVRELAQSIVGAYAPRGTPQFDLHGPDLALPAALISPVTLALHELATNSVKHGAMGSDAGRVTLEWDKTRGADGTTIRFVWRERGGPKVVAPVRTSGSTIVRNLAAASGGKIAFDWRESGLVVTGEFPL
ncbi:PAS domain-containing protein [Rhodobacteraceae bacterium 2CG4]|uniref:histidine kinase n=1 Tax=Halovulum marinum TaxID=2662447 RepID=A0A6L5Z105_9RHOB|nr:PAS domain-containing protein [Halovulum marinum]MSU90217.1 PAS domain-containing protein [Halovulum marinum]